jgi:hypothetical protein
MQKWNVDFIEALSAFMLLSLIILINKELQYRDQKRRRREKINYEASKQIWNSKRF